jgi:exosome complex component RRP41
MSSSREKPILIIDGKRLDGRSFDQLRPLSITTNVVPNADGSAFIEWGNNKIIAAVYGPKEALPKHTQDPERAVIKCRYAMSPFSSAEEHGSSKPNRRAIEISKITKEVFENVILIDEFPGGEINIYVDVLQSDGGTRAAGITAAAAAVASAGLPMRDIPYAVSVGKADGHLILDMNKIEDNYSDADVPMTICPRTKEIILLQMDGSFDGSKEFREAYSMVLKAGEEISRIQKEALKEPYTKIIDKYR